MKHRGSFRSAASALGVLLYVLSLSPAASAEVLTIGSDSEMTYAEDTVFENASSESTLSMGSGNTWDNDSSEQVTITNADGSFAVKGPRAGIYVPSGKTLTTSAAKSFFKVSSASAHFVWNVSSRFSACILYAFSN